jgi:hypothetical protein
MTLILQHPQTEDVKIVKVGFSWTVLFFGFIPVLYRGVYLHALALFLLIPLWAFSQPIYAFFINKLTAKQYLKKGYLPVEGLAWNYAKAAWNLTVFNIEAIPSNENIEIAAYLRQQTATRWIIISLFSPIIIGILAAVSIPKLADARNKVELQKASIEANTLTEEPATDTTRNDEITSTDETVTEDTNVVESEQAQ